MVHEYILTHWLEDIPSPVFVWLTRLLAVFTIIGGVMVCNSMVTHATWLEERMAEVRADGVEGEIVGMEFSDVPGINTPHGKIFIRKTADGVEATTGNFEEDTIYTPEDVRRYFYHVVAAMVIALGALITVRVSDPTQPFFYSATHGGFFILTTAAAVFIGFMLF